MNRRSFLAATASAVTVGAAGCVSTIAGAGVEYNSFIHPSASRSEAIDAVQERGGTVTRTYKTFDFFNAVDISQRLSNDPRVKAVETPDSTCESFDAETQYTSEGAWRRDMLGLSEAHERATGVNTDICVLDTGVAPIDALTVKSTYSALDAPHAANHPHGTKAASMAAADQSSPILGVAPDAAIHSAKVINSLGAGDPAMAIAGLDWCYQQEIPVLSMSFGSCSFDLRAAREAIVKLNEAGHLLVNASGNSGTTCDSDAVEPLGNMDGVISVGSVNQDGSVRDYTTRGASLDILAPAQTPALDRDGNVSDYGGTSQACPNVAGAGALGFDLLDVTKPDTAARDRIVEALYRTANPIDGDCRAAGILDVAALTAALSDDTRAPPHSHG